MATLRSSIQTLAQTFASQLLEAIRGMSLDEILHEAKGGAAVKTNGKTVAKATRKMKQTGRTRAISVEAIVSIAKKYPRGIRAEVLRRELGTKKDAFSNQMAAAVKSGAVRKTGTRRGTTYFAK
jgi:hypothetical protein